MRGRSGATLLGVAKALIYLHFTLKGVGGADPLVRGRRPRRPFRTWTGLVGLAKSGSGGTRADQGVLLRSGERPTICRTHTETNVEQDALK